MILIKCLSCATAKLLSAIMFFLLCLTNVKGEQVSENLLSTLSPMSIASGTFKQRKYFTVLKQPIISHGEVHFEQGLGLLWQTNQPVLSKLLLKKSGVYSDNGITPIKEIKGASSTAAILMNAVIGNVESIKNEFDVEPSNKLSCVTLIPREKLNKIIEKLSLCTSKSDSNKPSFHETEKSETSVYEPNNQTHDYSTHDYSTQSKAIKHVVLYEKSGNRTEIDLQLQAVNSLPEAIRAQLK